MDNNKNNPGQDGTMNNNNNNPQNQNQNQKNQNQNDQSFDNQNKNQQTSNNHDQNNMDREGEATTNTNKDGRSEEHQTNQDEKRYTGSKNPDGMDTNVSNRDKDFNEDIVNDEDRNKNLEE